VQAVQCPGAKWCFKKNLHKVGLSLEAHVYNPSLLGGGRNQEYQSLKPAQEKQFLF
jgi:hypothetical protein